MLIIERIMPYFMLLAVLALERKDFKRHKDVIAYFNQHYINTENFPKKLGHKISLAQSIREDSEKLQEQVKFEKIVIMMMNILLLKRKHKLK